MKNLHLTSPGEDARFTLDALLLCWTTAIAIAVWTLQGPIPHFAQGLWLISALALTAGWVALFEWAFWLWKDSAEEGRD